MNKTLSMHSAASEVHSDSALSRTLPLPPATTKAEKSAQFSSPQSQSAAKNAPQSGRPGALRRKVHTGAASRKSTATHNSARSGRDTLSTNGAQTPKAEKRIARARSTAPGATLSVAASDDAYAPATPGTSHIAEGCAARTVETGTKDEPHSGIVGCQDLAVHANDGPACAAAAVFRTEIDAMGKTKPASDSPSNNNAPSAETEALKVPTDPAALLDGPSYVRAVASKVDLVGASAKLVVSNDEKVAKAELDRLRELIFGKGGPPPSEDTLQIDWSSIPHPQRERVRFGDTSPGATPEAPQGDERDDS